MDPVFFINNRANLLKAVVAEVIILTAYQSMQRSNDASAQFEQEANFWYLTGIEAPGWSIVIESAKSYLIAPKSDEVHRLFDGVLSDESAKKISGVDHVLSHEDGEKLIKKLSKKYPSVATLGKDPRASHYDFVLNPAPAVLYRYLKKNFQSVEDCRLVLAKHRAIKQPEEIAAIRRAVDVTIEAFTLVKKSLPAYEYEYEIEADFTHHFRRSGAKGHAYDPIVASGEHACTLHYTSNDSKVKQNALVLLDIGARSNGYAADITRTYSRDA